MSFDILSFDGRFKDSKGRYEEIKELLVERLDAEASLEPEIPCDWDMVFEFKDDYLELSMLECLGNASDAIEFIKQEFVKEYPDVMVELFYKLYDSCYVEGEKVTYDGNVLKYTEHRASWTVDGYGIKCPKCKKEFLENHNDFFHCSGCGNDFSLQELGFTNGVHKLRSIEFDRFNKEIAFNLIV